MGLNVVFTGPAVLSCGKTIARKNLVKVCEDAGITVHDSVRDTTTLVVASRTDTVKSKNATLRGLTVMPYDSFVEAYLAGVDFSEGGELDPYTDVISTRNRKPSFGGSEQLRLLDIL